MSDVCRACKAPIVWARTEHGRAMPLDPEPDSGGNIAIVDDVAVVLTRAVLERLTGERRLYRSHFATCPYRDEFRRRP
jgi:hypothetical protein